MQASHSVSAVFDDPNLVSVAGLVPVLALARRAGLADLAAQHLSVPGPAGANSRVKVPALVAGMVAGADSVADMDLLRHGGMGRLFTGLRAPTTLGTHLRGYTFGHVRQLDALAARFLAALATCSPLLGGADQVAYLDIDDTIRATHGHKKQGVGYGYSKVKGLNALLATVSTPTAAPVIAATRLRRGNVNSTKGAPRLVADALVTARNAGVTGMVTVRADSAYYNHAWENTGCGRCPPKGDGGTAGCRPEGCRRYSCGARVAQHDGEDCTVGPRLTQHLPDGALAGFAAMAHRHRQRHLARVIAPSSGHDA